MYIHYQIIKLYTLNIYNLKNCETFIRMAMMASLTAQLVKNPPAMKETPVQFLGQEDPLEKGWATHSSVLGFPWWFSW